MPKRGLQVLFMGLPAVWIDGRTLRGPFARRGPNCDELDAGDRESTGRGPTVSDGRDELASPLGSRLARPATGASLKLASPAPRRRRSDHAHSRNPVARPRFVTPCDARRRWSARREHGRCVPTARSRKPRRARWSAGRCAGAAPDLRRPITGHRRARRGVARPSPWASCGSPGRAAAGSAPTRHSAVRGRPRRRFADNRLTLRFKALADPGVVALPA